MADARSEALANLCAITGADEDAAVGLLEATDWQLEEAVNLFFASGAAQGPGPAGGGPGPVSASSPNQQDFTHGMGEDDIRAPLPAKVDRLYGDHVPLPRPARIGMQAGPSRGQQPVDVFRSFKAEGAANDAAASTASGLSDLFKPPADLLYRGDLGAASHTAMADNKWLMLNVQAASEFASHRLNRDTFSHTVLKDALRGMFLFIQVQDNSPDGQTAVATYKLAQLPAILVVDPTTGAKLYARAGFVDAEQLLEDLVPFLDHGPQDAGGAELAQRLSLRSSSRAAAGARAQAAAGPSNGPTPSARPPTEDDELAMAIALSMEQTQGGGDGAADDDEDEGEDAASGSGGSLGWNEAAEQQAASGTAAGERARTPVTALAPHAVPPPKLSPEAVQAEAREQLGPEPDEGQDVCRIGLRLPGGSRAQRRFRKAQTVQALHDWFRSLDVEAAGGRAYVLALPFPGAAPLSDAGQGLVEAGLANAMVAVKWAA